MWKYHLVSSFFTEYQRCLMIKLWRADRDPQHFPPQYSYFGRGIRTVILSLSQITALIGECVNWNTLTKPRTASPFAALQNRYSNENITGDKDDNDIYRCIKSNMICSEQKMIRRTRLLSIIYSRSTMENTRRETQRRHGNLQPPHIHAKRATKWPGKNS